MRKPGRIDLLLIGLILVISAIFSCFKGYIELGIELIMVISGGYLIASAFFDKPKEKPPVKAKCISNNNK